MRAGPRSVIADDELLFGEVVRGLNRGGVIGDADIGLGGWCAEIGKLGCVELRPRLAGQRTERSVARDRRYGGAVLRRQIVDEIGGAVAAGAFQILRRDRRMAGQVRAD